MPISAANMALYPGGSIHSPEWLAIREQVRERAGDACEECGVGNGWFGYRLADGTFIRTVSVLDGLTAPRKVIRIVCTVAHFDCKLVDHSLGNLRFWCQQCHNRHDVPARAAGRKARQ